MCGIAGYIGSTLIPDERVRLCLERMHRRGPNASGMYRHMFANAQHFCLLHSRLSIIDLDSRADQPMRRDNMTIAFNGEIYNYLEVGAELKALGVELRSNSDTEVLLTALINWGHEDALDHFEGMWAFAAYEEHTGRLTLSRDRFGEKPLYLYRDATGLYFGSEVKFISTICGRKFTPNQDQILRYLINGYKSLYKTTDTFLEEIKPLPAGHSMSAGPGGIEEAKRYWSVTPRFDSTMDYPTAVERTQEALARSMKLRLRADVPLAFCMSGGVDSNSLISLAKNVHNHDVHGFTIINTDQRYDEEALVKAAVQKQGLRHTAVPVSTNGFLDGLRELVKYHDCPVYTISYYAHWLLMRAVSEGGYKVSISGTGADELFTGYYDHHNMYLAMVANDDNLYKSSLDNWKQHIQPIVRNPYLQDPKAFMKNPQLRDHIYLDADLYASWMHTEFDESFTEERYVDDLLRNRMLNELFHESIPVILHEDDLNAMYYSIENRSPFLDRKLFETCMTIPTNLLIRDGRNKAILRDAMNGIVPQIILDNRHKIGFNASLLEFLDPTSKQTREAVLDESPIFDIVNRQPIEKLLSKKRLSNSESKFLFSVLTTKMFLESSQCLN